MKRKETLHVSIRTGRGSKERAISNVIGPNEGKKMIILGLVLFLGMGILLGLIHWILVIVPLFFGFLFLRKVPAYRKEQEQFWKMHASLQAFEELTQEECDPLVYEFVHRLKQNLPPGNHTYFLSREGFYVIEDEKNIDFKQWLSTHHYSSIASASVIFSQKTMKYVFHQNTLEEHKKLGIGSIFYSRSHQSRKIFSSYSKSFSISLRDRTIKEVEPKNNDSAHPHTFSQMAWGVQTLNNALKTTADQMGVKRSKSAAQAMHWHILLSTFFTFVIFILVYGTDAKVDILK